MALLFFISFKLDKINNLFKFKIKTKFQLFSEYEVSQYSHFKPLEHSNCLKKPK
jgi:hypothetical protein